MQNNCINRLRDMRSDIDKTQKEVAEDLKLHTTTYARWEQNPLQIKLADLIMLAEYYKSSIDYIAGLTDEKRPLFKNK